MSQRQVAANQTSQQSIPETAATQTRQTARQTTSRATRAAARRSACKLLEVKSERHRVGCNDASRLKNKQHESVFDAQERRQVRLFEHTDGVAESARRVRQQTVRLRRSYMRIQTQNQTHRVVARLRPRTQLRPSQQKQKQTVDRATCQKHDRHDV